MSEVSCLIFSGKCNIKVDLIKQVYSNIKFSDDIIYWLI